MIKLKFRFMIKSLLIIFFLLLFISAYTQDNASRIKSINTYTVDSIEQSIDVQSFNYWSLASTPKFQPILFPEGISEENNVNRLNCAKISWYSIDPLFLRNNAQTPAHIKHDPNTQSSFYVNEVFQKQLFPEIINNSIYISTLNLSFYPKEKGFYNFDVSPSHYSAGIDSFGNLKNPQSRWGGIIRKLGNSVWNKSTLKWDNYYSFNYKFIDFWLMDSFVESPTNEGGELYFNIGNISEDILNFGIMDKETHDYGLDNLSYYQEERSAYKPYLDSIVKLYGWNSPAYKIAFENPSCDLYHYYRGTDYDQQQLGILERYKKYNGIESNSTLSSIENYPNTAGSFRNTEDINRNDTLDLNESYYQYKIKISTKHQQVGSNYITEKRLITTTFPNHIQSSVYWFHYRIPLNNPDTNVENFNQLVTSKFMRIFLKGFTTETHLRFAKLNLVYLEKREYKDLISIYPNPTKGILTIDFDNKNPQFIILYNQLGELIFEKQIKLVNNQKVYFDFTFLCNGIYFLKLVLDNEIIVKKILKE